MLIRVITCLTHVGQWAQQAERGTLSSVWFPTPNPSGTVKTEDLMVLELVPHRHLGPRTAWESGWIKYLNICPVLYCSILSS